MRNGRATLRCAVAGLLLLVLLPSSAAAASTCFGQAATIVGTSDDDVLEGTNGSDVIDGLEGNDLIDGGGGNDVLCGGEGSDGLYGNTGSDRLQGGPGDDGEFLPSRSGPLNARLDGGPGRDLVRGGRGNDEINGGVAPLTNAPPPDGADDLYGDRGEDHICDNGCFSNEIQSSDAADDHLFGGPGKDRLSSSGGDDYQAGGKGADDLGFNLFDNSNYGTVLLDIGSDIYWGEAGSDRLNGTDEVKGNDALDGGEDTDACESDAEDTISRCEGPLPG